MTKKPKILIGINTLTEVNQTVYMSHMILIYRLGRSYPKFDFAICAPRRMAIDNMRNFCAKAAIDGKFEYLWFIDDDVLLPSDALTHLLNLKADIAAGITLIRGYPYNPMLFSFAKDRKNGAALAEYEQLIESDGSIRDSLDAVGFSCCLIRTALLRKVKAPWFLTGPGFTEDVFFCGRAKEFKLDLTIAATNKVQTEHILGSETICPANRKARIKYDEILNPQLKHLGNKQVFTMSTSNKKDDSNKFTVMRGAQFAENYKRP